MEIIKYRISLPSLPLHPSFSTCLITFPPTSAHSALIFPTFRNGNSAISFCLWQPLSLFIPPHVLQHEFIFVFKSLTLDLFAFSSCFFLSFSSLDSWFCPFLTLFLLLLFLWSLKDSILFTFPHNSVFMILFMMRKFQNANCH